MEAAHRRYGVIVVAAAVAIIVSFVFAASRTSTHRHDLAVQQRIDRHLCNEVRDIDTVLIAQLRGALMRLNASVDKSSPIWQAQHKLLTDGIHKLTSHTCRVVGGTE